MLIDVRTYRCRPGTINTHLLYMKSMARATVSLPWQPLVYLKGETGDPNEYIHIWVYENAGDREAKN